MENEELFEFMTKMYGEMKEGFDGVNKRIGEVYNRITNVELKLELDIETKIEALFDGYKQNSDKLDRIEIEVSKHEDFILMCLF